jgi:hypothetical protein
MSILLVITDGVYGLDLVTGSITIKHYTQSWNMHLTSDRFVQSKMTFCTCNMNPITTLQVLYWGIQLFWNETLCHWVSGFWWFEASWLLHLQESSYSLGLFFMDCFNVEDVGVTVLWNVRIRSPSDTTSHLGRLESSATPLWKSQISQL